MADICAGLNVVEIGSGSIAASMAGMVLADAGAHVIKLEPPDGDALRTCNPSGFLVWNRGKDSLVADLRADDGRARLRKLAGAADVVIEGFAPSVTREWGVGATDLCAINSRLVHCAITAFGSDGPLANVKGLDELVAAKVGLWSRGVFGHRDGPQMYPVPWASYGAAMQSIAGIVGALLVRDVSGRGQRLDATLYAGLDPLDYFVCVVVELMRKRGEKPNADARDLTAASRFGLLVATADGRFIQTSTLLPHQASALCAVAGVLEKVEADPRFASMPKFDTPADAQAWEDLLMEAFRAKDLDHWLPRLEANADVAFELARTPEECLDHPQIVFNGDVITIDDPDLGPVRQVGPVGHFSRTPMTPVLSTPRLGSGFGGFRAVAGQAADGSARDMPGSPYDGTTIVEFGYFYAMPYATTMLAELGARVIKIEDGAGDPFRHSFGPEIGSTKTTAGKQSVSLDLRTEQGREIARQIVAKADVFITGFRSGVAERLGLGEDELRALNPRLLYVHAAGYGTGGPYAHRALYAQAAQAAGGSFGRQVGYWSDPTRNLGMSVMELQAVVIPRLGQVVDGDSNAALALLAALSLGILHQRRTGEGQRLDCSMIGGNALAYSDDFCEYDAKPPAAHTDEDSWGMGALDRCYPAAESSFVCVAVRTEAEAATLFATIGLPELSDDPRFATAAARAAHDAELAALLAHRFVDRPAAEWEGILLAADVGCVRADTSGHAMVIVTDPDLQAAGLTVTYQHPMFGEMVKSAPVVRFSETSGRVGLPCLRGQHNRTVLAELGYDGAAVDEFERAGVVIADASPS